MMVAVAFVGAPLPLMDKDFLGVRTNRAAVRSVRHAKPLRKTRVSRCSSSRPGPGKGGASAEDDALSQELQNKVKELFGGRQNVSIEMEKDSDSGVQFNVRVREARGEYLEARAAWTVIGSIAVVSLIAGIAFTALYYAGAVHGSRNERHYDMPTYGKESYINPYEILEDESLSQGATESAPHPEVER